LFEDAGGAYQYNDFSESRQYLVDRLCAQQPAAYFPESAYWVAFDNSVPLFLPIYVRTRLTDLSLIRTQAAPPPCAPLDEHLIFSSGWEWSYWLHDVTAMRASYEMPASPEDAIAEQYAPDLGAGAASVVSDLADEQHDALLVRRLAAYLAGRDALIDAGRMIGVISQPDRITFDDLVAATPDARLDFNNSVLGALADHIAVLDALALRLDGLGIPTTRWGNELRQGLAIDRARAKFVFAAYRTVLDHLVGNDDDGAAQDRRDAQAAFDAATAIVHDRDGDLHDPDGTSITEGDSANATVYGYGYLYTADTLCYWQRELDQIDAILTNTDITPPACVL
ncbi:MAG TPA: hypothetical protein VGO00_24835, partial [Kofleriaceae bacterium]|nr:hypothetical protein [Kofleriaceae bacterium]